MTGPKDPPAPVTGDVSGRFGVKGAGSVGTSLAVAISASIFGARLLTFRFAGSAPVRESDVEAVTRRRLGALVWLGPASSDGSEVVSVVLPI